MALTVSIFDHNVNNVNSFKYLVIFISSDFTWTNHVEKTAGKINQRLSLLNRIKHLLPFIIHCSHHLSSHWLKAYS